MQVATWWIEIPLAADAQNCNFLKKRVADSRRLEFVDETESNLQYGVVETTPTVCQRFGRLDGP